jgi:hypothetical protein
VFCRFSLCCLAVFAIKSRRDFSCRAGLLGSKLREQITEEPPVAGYAIEAVSDVHAGNRGHFSLWQVPAASLIVFALSLTAAS